MSCLELGSALRLSLSENRTEHSDVVVGRPASPGTGRYPQSTKSTPPRWAQRYGATNEQ